MTKLEVTRHLRKEHIDWDINESGGGFVAVKNGLEIYLKGGDEHINITLTIVGNCRRSCSISQPRLHISKVPAGKAVKFVAGTLGLPEPFSNLSQEEKDDIEFSENLEEILRRAREKFKLRLSDPHEYAVYQEEKEQKLLEVFTGV